MTTQSLANQVGISTNRGMCANAFGGYARLDKIEVSQLADGRCSGEESLYRSVILEAVNSYLWFGLGRNGFVAKEFLWSADYFFNVTSDKPETWNEERSVQISDIALGTGKGKGRKFIALTDEEMSPLCFDQQYELSGLCRSMTIRRFRKLLAEKRRAIVKGNIRQISAYLGSLMEKAATAGEFLTPGVAFGDLVEVLVAPTAEGLASLIYPARTLSIPKPHRSPFRMPRRERGRRMLTRINRRSDVLSAARVQPRR